MLTKYAIRNTLTKKFVTKFNRYTDDIYYARLWDTQDAAENAIIYDNGEEEVVKVQYTLTIDNTH